MEEVLNYYFATVFTVEDTDYIQEVTPAKPNLTPLSDCHLTEDVVTKAYAKIKVKSWLYCTESLKRGNISNQQTSCNTIK